MQARPTCTCRHPGTGSYGAVEEGRLASHDTLQGVNEPRPFSGWVGYKVLTSHAFFQVGSSVCWKEILLDVRHVGVRDIAAM